MALASHTYLWPDPDSGPYRVEIGLDDIDGHLVPVRWTIAGEPAGRPDNLPTVALHATVVRQVRWAEMSDRLGDELRHRWAPIIARTKATDVALRLAMPPSRRGRPTLYDDDHWGQVADVYRSAATAPVRTVAERWVVSRTTARKWVERCRRKGLIGPSAGAGG